MTQLTPQAALKQYFGYTEFRPGQAEVIGHLLANKSAAAVFPTGGGKSLCYQIPAVLLPGVTLVVSPLIALMKDQIDALAARGIAAARLDSTLSLDEYRQVISDVRSGMTKLLYVAPERFNNERFRETLEKLPVSLFAIDEAHCISEWGHNFRPDYLKLAEYARRCRAERVLALTATATDKVLTDIRNVFAIAPECAVRTGFYRPNLTLLTTPIAAAQRDAELLKIMRERPVGPTIVYVTLQRTAEEVAEQLSKAGFDARPYHAGLKDELRAEVQDWFLGSKNAVVVATIAFGMGIDKSDVRYIYHYNLPKSLENYAQEIGRAGRDGAESICQMFACPDDLNALENFVYGDTPSREAIGTLVEELFAASEEFDVSNYDLSYQHDIRQLVVRTLLTYLELEGYLVGGTPVYSSYKFKPLVPSAQMLNHFQGERREFLASLLRQAKKAATWFTIDLAKAGQATGAPRDRIVRALDYLAEQGWLELKVEGVRLPFRRLKSPTSTIALADAMFQRAIDHELREVQRLQQVIKLVERSDCQVAALGAHFGEKMAKPCGHCSACQERGGRKMPARHTAKLELNAIQRATELRREHPAALGSPRASARLLCGVGSPKLSRAKLSSNPLFGACADVPFQAVLAQLEKAN